MSPGGRDGFKLEYTGSETGWQGVGGMLLSPFFVSDLQNPQVGLCWPGFSQGISAALGWAPQLIQNPEGQAMGTCRCESFGKGTKSPWSLGAPFITLINQRWSHQKLRSLCEGWAFHSASTPREVWLTLAWSGPEELGNRWAPQVLGLLLSSL